MKAAVLRTLGRFEIEEATLDDLQPDELRVRTLASGLCHSDYHVLTGDLPVPLPLVAGHEACGIVEAVGADVGDFRPGDRVVTCTSAFCGHCGECQRGHNHRCDAPPVRAGDWRTAARIRDAGGEPLYQLAKLGAFAEEMIVHRTSVVAMPAEMPAASAALLGCAVLTGIGAVLNGAEVPPGARVAVIGCGGVGLNVVQGARIAGAERIVAIDTRADKLALARTFGATDTVLAGPDTAAAVCEATGGGVDYAFEVVGLPTTMREACLMLRKGGTAVLVGVAPAGSAVSVPTDVLLYKEIRVIGSLMGSSAFQLLLPQLGRWYRSGALKLDDLVSETIPLAAINAGYARMAEGGVARVVLTM